MIDNMLLSTIDKLDCSDGDYAVLVDYGYDGIIVLSQHVDLQHAIHAMHDCTYGYPMAVVKVCRIQAPVEVN